MMRKPKFEKVGCYFKQGDGMEGFQFFSGYIVDDGDVFVYNKGILFKLKRVGGVFGDETPFSQKRGSKEGEG